MCFPGSRIAAAGFLRKPARALAAATIGRTFTEVTASAGASLPLLGTSPRTGIRWVDANAAIGPALGAQLHVTENALAGLASAETVAQLARNMSEWQGEQPTLGRAWLTEATHQIPPKEQPLARLALLAGRAAYLVTENDVAAVRSVHTSDAALLRIVAWGSGAASRRVFLKALRVMGPRFGIDAFQQTGLRHYIEEHKLGSFERGAPTDHVKITTGREPEDFATISRRYASRPEAQRGPQNLIKALLDFTRIGLTPALDLKKVEQEQLHPTLPCSMLAALSPVWNEERDALDRTKPPPIGEAATT